MGKDAQPDPEVMGTALKPHPLGPNPGPRQRQGPWAGILLPWASGSMSRAGGGGEGKWGAIPQAQEQAILRSHRVGCVLRAGRGRDTAQLRFRAIGTGAGRPHTQCGQSFRHWGQRRPAVSLGWQGRPGSDRLSLPGGSPEPFHLR